MGILKTKIIDNPFLLWIKTELSERMAQNLAFIRIDPNKILIENKIDTKAVTELKKIYPKSSLIASFPLPKSPLETILQIKKAFTKNTETSNLVSNFDLIWTCNLAIPKGESTESKIKTWHELNATDGLLMLTYLGPDTAKEFQEIFSTKPDIVDMHDFGDLLVHCGYSDPVMTMEYLKLEYVDIEILLKELKTLNLFQEMNESESSPKLLEKVNKLKSYDGKWHLTLEIVYGHAWKVEKRKKHITTIDANSILVKKK
jgi:malonyl-CoA O-methyltransferase